MAAINYRQALLGNQALEVMVFKSGFSRRQVAGVLKRNHRKVNEKNVERAIKGLIKRGENRKEVRGRDASFSDPRPEWQIVYGKVRTGGAITFVNSSADHSKLQLVITLAAHRICEIEKLYLNNTEVNFGTTFTSNGQSATSVNFDGKVFMQVNMGDHTTALSQLITDSGGLWTANHKQLRMAHVYLRLAYNEAVFPDGIPEVEFLIKGKHVLPYTGLSVTFPGGFTKNPGLIAADFLNDTYFGGGREQSGYVNYADDAIIISEERVTNINNATEARYECSGIWSAAESRRSILEDILSSMAGSVVVRPSSYWGWDIYAAGYKQPQFTITEDDILAAVDVSRFGSRRNFMDSVRANYVDPSTFESSSAPVMKTPAGYFAAESTSYPEEITLPATTSRNAAQRLAKIFLLRSLIYSTQVNLLLRMDFIKLSPPDHVRLTLSRYGWASNVFEVESCQPTLVMDGNNAPYLAASVRLKETAEAVYTFSRSEEQSGIVQVPLAPPAPGFSYDSYPQALTVVSQGEELTNFDGTIIYRARLSYTPPSDSFIAYLDFEFKTFGATTWNPAGSVEAQTAFFYVDNLTAGQTYSFRVRPRSVDNRVGIWLNFSHHTIQAKVAGPPDVSDFVGRVEGSWVNLSWSASPDPDVAYYLIKEVTISPTWEVMEWPRMDAAVNIRLPIQFQNTTARIVGSAGSDFRIRAVNSNGVLSNTMVKATIGGTPTSGNPVGLLLSITYP